MDIDRNGYCEAHGEWHGDCYATECPHCGDDDCQYKESEWYWHEVMDRAWVIFETFEDHVSRHPATEHDDELKRHATIVLRAMSDFYQTAATKLDRHYQKENGIKAKNKSEIVDLSDYIQFKDEWNDHK